MATRIRLTAVLLGALLFAGCSTAPRVEGSEPLEPVFPIERFDLEEVESPLEVYDPWEGLNRRVYRFNYEVDRYVLIPAVNAYRAITPRFVRTGVRNFFSNIINVRTLINQVLQVRPAPAAQTAGRLAVNSTIGIAGLFDPATAMGMPYHVEDFGQTLGVWGFRPGPYLIVPVLGPGSLRDGVGLVGDALWRTQFDRKLFDGSDWRYPYYALYTVNERDKRQFRRYGTGSPFEYELVRMLILTRREIDIAK